MTSRGAKLAGGQYLGHRLDFSFIRKSNSLAGPGSYAPSGTATMEACVKERVPFVRGSSRRSSRVVPRVPTGSSPCSKPLIPDKRLPPDDAPLYITGDTILFDDRREIPRRHPDIDLALFPLGGIKIMGMLLTMDAEQGVEAIRTIDPREVVPIHCDDHEVFESPPEDFKEAVVAAGFEERVGF
jgi:hypothetical protein